MTSPPLRRTAIPLAGAALLLAGTALPASAHVRVSSPDAAPGGFGKLVFRVPNESDSAATTKVSVTLPTDTPFAFVSSKPAQGWSLTTTERRLDKPLEVEGFTLTKVVSTVTWTAQRGQGLKPGEFDEFELSVGPFPEKVRTLDLPATQTYSDGEVVRWDQHTPKGGKEPEHPAPALDLSRASTATAVADRTPTTRPATPEATSDATARWLGGAGLALGVLALLAAVLPRGRRSGAERTS